MVSGGIGLRLRLALMALILAGLGLATETAANAALGPVVVSQAKDSDPGPGDGDPLQGGNDADEVGGVDLDGVLIYDANDGFSGPGHGQELWRSDGTEAGTYLLKDIFVGATFSSSPNSMIEMNGEVYFAALEDNFTTGIELWKTDGTEQGTNLLKDLHPGLASGAPQQLTNVNGTLYFLADSDFANGYELWKSNGTEAGTVMVRDIGSTAHNLTAVGNRLFFTFNDGVNGKELWTSDGTFFGTTQVENIGPGATSGLPGAAAQGRSEYFNFEGKLYFRANDGVHGRELWRSDGTAAGTEMVKDIDGTAGDSMTFDASFEQLGNELFFAWDFGIYKTDGTGPGTVPAGSAGNTPTQLTAVDGTLYFIQDFTKLYRSDGTAPGTQLVFDAQSVISRLTVFDGNIYTSFDDGPSGGTSGVELWRSDGTASGTERLTDINPGGGGSLVNERTVAGDRLYFRGDDDGATGVELWSVLADRTPPQTTIDSGPSEGEIIETDSVTFAFSSDEAGATFTCVFDGGPPESCDSGTKSYTGLSEGPHSFGVTATDTPPFGNVELTPATRNFSFEIPVDEPPVDEPPVVDTTAPTLRLQGQKKQKSPKRIVIKATCLDEACRLKATGRINVKIMKPGGNFKTRSLKLRPARSSAGAGRTVTLRLKLNNRTKKLVRRVLTKKPSRVKIKVTATDTAGNSVTRSRTVTLFKQKRKRASR